MSIRLEKHWKPLTLDEVDLLGRELGVYQIADEDGVVQKIGYAGGKSLFGLKSALEKEFHIREGRPHQFRCEVTMQYMSRYEELLMIHQADHHSLPPENEEDRPARLGALNPA